MGLSASSLDTCKAMYLLCNVDSSKCKDLAVACRPWRRSDKASKMQRRPGCEIRPSQRHASYYGSYPNGFGNVNVG